MRSSWVILVAGCTATTSPPSGTYSVTASVTQPCARYDTQEITFGDAENVSVLKRTPVATPQAFAATNVQIDTGHVTFDLSYSVRNSDSGTFESGNERYVLTVDADHLSGTESGSYSGSYEGRQPYACDGEVSLDGVRAAAARQQY